jgi:hypothetical protein
MVMRLDNLAGLMAPRASQTRPTRPREAVTSALMAIPSFNSWCTKREITLVNSFIPPLHFLLLLGSSERFLTFSLCNCVSSIALSGEFSPYPFITPLLSLDPHMRFLCISLGFSPALRLFRALPSTFQLPLCPLPSASAFFPPCQEKGGSLGEVRCTTTPSPGVAYFPPPNWLSLLLVSLAPGIIARGRRSLLLHPLTPSMEISRLKRKRHHRASTLLFPLVFCPPQKSIHRTKCMATKVAWWRRKSPQAGRWRRTR